MRTHSESSVTTLSTRTFVLQGSQKKKRKRKGMRKYLWEILVQEKKINNMGKEIHTQVQESQSPTQDKPKEKHANTHIINLMKIKHEDKNI